MTRFTPKFFRSGTGVLQKQGAHRRLGELIVHFLVAGLAGFRAYILSLAFSAFLSSSFAGALEKLRCYGDTFVFRFRCFVRDSKDYLPLPKWVLAAVRTREKETQY